MSVQFGRWAFNGPTPSQAYLKKVESLLAPYGPDGQDRFASSDIAILYFPFHTTAESRREIQPHISSSGAVFTWDGRLDNRTELLRELGKQAADTITDIAIVVQSYKRWGTDCFRKLVGDWALAIWEPRNHQLFLVKDFLGSRHLYYSLDENQVTWSSVLDPCVLLAGTPFRICEEYIAGWLSSYPATHLTPYWGIHSVPPASFVLFQPAKHITHRYWCFDPGKIIRYHHDGEYEEHFRTVFNESVCRRLRSDRPVLAELSGGLDSCSIVCTADALIAQDVVDTPRLDTLSYYDDDEPNWNERPFFSLVETKRGRVGLHIDVGLERNRPLNGLNERLEMTPGSGAPNTNAAHQVGAYLASHNIRVVLSGVGGDETTGGIPTPMPELADLLASVRFGALARQLKTWALSKRRPWLLLLAETVRSFLPAAEDNRSKSWLTPEFARKHQSDLIAHKARVRFFGPSPSFQENMTTLEALRRQLACTPPSVRPMCEKRYPFLDRNFLEFLFAIPREQLVRPHQRRSLLRRSLSGIVPEEILNRRRKAYITRSSIAALREAGSELSEYNREMLIASLGMINRQAFMNALHEAGKRADSPLVLVQRVLMVEHWLRQSLHQGVLRKPTLDELGHGFPRKHHAGRAVEVGL